MSHLYLPFSQSRQLLGTKSDETLQTVWFCLCGGMSTSLVQSDLTIPLPESSWERTEATTLLGSENICLSNWYSYTHKH